MALLTRGLLAELDSLTEILVERIRTADQAYVIRGVPIEDLRQSCRNNLEQVLAALSIGGVSDEALAPARTTGARRATQGLPLEALLHAYRVGGQLVWQQLVVEAVANEERYGRALLDGATAVWAVIDAFSEAAAAAYRECEYEGRRANERRGEAVLNALLDGRGRYDPVITSEAERFLGLPARGPFLVCAAMSGEDSVTARLRDLAVPMGAVLHVAAVRRPDVEVLVLHVAPKATRGVERLLNAMPGVRAGVSALCTSLATLDSAFAQALIALDMVPPAGAGAALLQDHIAAALLLRSPDLARLLLDDVVAPLMAIDPDERELLLNTFWAYVAAGGATSLAADRLYCHRNTVLKRLHRLEGLLNTRLVDTPVPLNQLLALHAAQLPRAQHDDGGSDFPR